MSQTVIVTTPEDLTAIITAAVSQAQAALPPDVHELERLKRKELLVPDEVEKLYGLNARTLSNKRVQGRGPEYIQEEKGAQVYYDHKSIQQYLLLCRKKTYA